MSLGYFDSTLLLSSLLFFFLTFPLPLPIVARCSLCIPCYLSSSFAAGAFNLIFSFL
jgi:hypothetical protein